MSAPTTPQWRRTTDGEWVVYGPASLVAPGDVTVTKKSGEVSHVSVASVGGIFLVDGVECRYGHVAADSDRLGGDVRGVCANDGCGRRPAVTRRHDMSGISGMVCTRCARVSVEELSFA